MARSRRSMGASGIVIVGAGSAGLATARSYREHGGRRAVTLLGSESYLPYRRPPLTKEFLRGELDRAELPIHPVEWFEEQGIDLRLDCEASAIDPRTGSVRVGASSFDGEVIVLATGAEPSRPETPGLDDPRVLTMRDWGDSEAIARYARPCVHSLVLGTGFIGCELAASLALSGGTVTLVGQEDGPQEDRLGGAVAGHIARWLGELGVRLEMGGAVEAVHGGRIAELDDGRRIEADKVVLAMGVRPRIALAEHAGLPIAEGAILTDDQMRAGAGVLAVGDVAYACNRTAGRRLRVEHWGDALEQGELAGRVLAGEDAHWGDVPGFWSSIAGHTIKYAAWGDGHDQSRIEEHPDGAFTVWSEKEGKLVGVLTHKRDEDYERGQTLIAAVARAPRGP